MTEHTKIEDRRFIFVKDVDGQEVPVFLGSLVVAIRTGALPGFEALNLEEQELADEVLQDAEHHHRARLNADNENWKYEAEFDRKFRSLRIRLGLSLHYEKADHCPYIVTRTMTTEGIGL